MKKQYIIIPIVMLAMLIALSIPTSAYDGSVAIDSFNRFEIAVPHGDFTVKWINYPSPFTFSVPDKELYWVGIYDSVWMPNDPIHASYNGHTLPDSNCTSLNTRWWTGCGTTGVWFDDETGNTTQGADNTYNSWNVDNAHGTAAPIVYIDTNPNTLYYWFYQGYDDAEGYDPCPGYDYCMDYTFHNVTASVATKWTLMVAVTCADNGDVTFNGNALPNGYPIDTWSYHVAINDVTGMVNDGDNTVGLRTDDMYFHPYWMWLVGETPGGVPKPDLTVTDIDAGTPRPEHNSTVNATILNQGDAGAGAFNVGLFINGSLNDTVRVEAGLPAGDSIPVSLTTAKLPENCYEFKVVADSDGEIVESDESNNAAWKDHQVGYVIVVRSDSDFAKLKQECDEGKLPTGSVTYDSGTDTYYIQNLWITNCAGEGILIVDTSKNFVINNCTVENCKPAASGVFLNNVTKGTINGSTLQNNEAYGVELGLVPLSDEDPKFINITNNKFYHNKNGIDLIGFNCIVKDNLVQDSTEYGIYVYGNDNNVTNNNITYNGDYGVKLYNSAGNYVYANRFTDNNVDYPEHTSQGWDNNANYWNTSEKGNWWSDWNGLSTYAIDGGTNKDHHPEGPEGVEVEDKAKEDKPVKGTVTGSYGDTHVSDNVREAIEEVESKGKPTSRYSLLEHKWSIDVRGASDFVFYLEAHHSTSTDGDDFEFAYSKSLDGDYTPMVTVIKTADDHTYQTYNFTESITGTVYIRVQDTNRDAGKLELNTVYIDHMYIKSKSGSPSYGVTVTIDETSQTVAPGESTTYTVRVKNTGGLDASYNVVMSGTAVDESTIDVNPLSWNTGTLVPNTENVTTVTVSTTLDTSETTYTLIATATCEQEGSVKDSSTSELVVSSVTNAMHISSIDMSLKKAGPNTNAVAVVTIVDATGIAVEGAAVSGHWSGATSDTDSGTTTSGQVSLNSDKVKNAPSGTTFTFTVDNVELTGWTYDSASNVETSDSITV